MSHFNVKNKAMNLSSVTFESSFLKNQENFVYRDFTGFDCYVLQIYIVAVLSWWTFEKC